MVQKFRTQSLLKLQSVVGQDCRTCWQGPTDQRMDRKLHAADSNHLQIATELMCFLMKPS